MDDKQITRPVTPLEVFGTLCVSSMAFYAIRVVGVRALEVIRSRPSTESHALEDTLKVAKKALEKK
jgi:hypothetical protein